MSEMRREKQWTKGEERKLGEGERGVGEDTMAAFSRQSPNAAALPTTSKSCCLTIISSTATRGFMDGASPSRWGWWMELLS
ncbi:hypothetical protein pipiens_015178, partial [Culex pipiens pipiens]